MAQRPAGLQEFELNNHMQHRGIIPLTQIDSLMPNVRKKK